MVILRRQHASCSLHNSRDPFPILSALLCPPETPSEGFLEPGESHLEEAAMESTVFTQTPIEMLRG